MAPDVSQPLSRVLDPAPGPLHVGGGERASCVCPGCGDSPGTLVCLVCRRGLADYVARQRQPAPVTDEDVAAAFGPAFQAAHKLGGTDLHAGIRAALEADRARRP